MQIKYFSAVCLWLATSAVSFGGCGGVDNVQSCKDWVAATKCGATDVGALIPCDSYDQTSCDISEYFDCLTANTKCENEVLDTSGWLDCLAKAKCE